MKRLRNAPLINSNASPEIHCKVTGKFIKVSFLIKTIFINKTKNIITTCVMKIISTTWLFSNTINIKIMKLHLNKVKLLF